MTVLTAIPAPQNALWLVLLGDGMGGHDSTRRGVAVVVLALSAVGTWYLRVLFDRLQRRFRDKISVALQTHVARLQAAVSTIEHHERPEYLDRLSVLRDQVFALDHMFMSLFGTVGWLIRLGLTVVLLASVHPALIVLVL